MTGLQSGLYDVAIIGGGPAGCQAAYRLSLAGHKVVVLEKRTQPGGPVCCTGIVSRECADIFHFNGNLTLRRVNSARIFSPSGKALMVWRPETQACVLNRALLDAEMAQRVRTAGGEYLTGSTVGSVEHERDNVSIKFTRDGSKYAISSRSVVLAGGFVPKTDMAPAGPGDSDYAVGVQADVETNGIDETEVYFGRQIAPGFFGWLVPVTPGKGIVGLMARRKAGVYLKQLLVRLAGEGKIRSAEVDISYRVLPFHASAKTYGRRLLVAGSAAGQVKPLTGGGIYYGMLCAGLAADTLHRALETDDLSAKNLSGYERTWHKLLGSEIRASYRGRKLLEKLNDGHLNKIFEFADKSGILESLLESEEITFDRHSNALKALFSKKVLFGLGGMVKEAVSS